MRYFFDIKENDAALKRILDEWLGTPFRHHCGVKGKGCDCVHFVAKVLEELGIIKWRNNLIPEYPRDWHLHQTREALKDSVLRELKAESVTFDSLRNGDILLSHYGKASSHAAIYYEEHVYQSLTKIGVKRINFNDSTYFKQMKFAFRILL